MGLTETTVELVQRFFAGYEVLGLVVVAVTEAVFSPFPPDALLVVLATGRSLPYATFLGAVTTAASVAGGAVGYWIGDRFSDWAHRKFAGEHLARAEAWYQQYGEWVVGVAAFTPIPFKVFTVASGLLGLRFWPFMLAATVGRGVRFVPEAILASFYGERIVDWIDAYEIPLLVAALLALAGLYAYSRTRGEAGPAGGAER